MEQRVKQLEGITNNLKIRLFDAQEQIAFMNDQIKEREDVLMEIVKLANVQPNENGEVGFGDIVEAVRALIPVEVPVDSNSVGVVEDAQV